MDRRLDELLQRCTVKLKVPGKIGWGSGFFIAPGLILTCAHVVKGMNLGGKVQVSSQEQISFPDTTLVQLIPDYDLALLRFSPSSTVNLPCVYLAPDFEPFDRFYTFGYSDRFPDGASVTSECEGTAFEQGKELILFKSGQIRPGISGSALLNWATGKVCGIVKFTRDRTTDLGGGAIPTQVILEQFPQIKELQKQFHQQDDHWVKSLKVPTEETWREACRNWIKARRSLVTNLFVDILGTPLDLDEIHVPLGLLERQRKPIAPKDVSPEAGSQVYRPEQIELFQEASVNIGKPANKRERQETITPISYDDFFRRVLAQRQSPKSQGKRLAIIGEAGAGKTVQLLKIADWVLNATKELPVWISLGALGEKKSLRDYMFDTWLPAATARLKEYSSQWENDLEQRLKNGKIWLLLDGADEMRGANPLGRLTQELNGSLFAGTRVVLSCRVSLWDKAGSTPSEFDTYKMLDFSYGEGQQPDQVKQFIEKWFTAINHLEWGDSLRMALDELGKERIKDLARNPLRLGFLCFNWQENQGNLPETKAMLYQQFVESFYLISEKTKGIELTPKQQSILNKSLGQLAKQAIDRGCKSILPHNLVYQELVESQPENLGFDVFDLVLKLGWLNRVGMAPADSLHNVYAFFHPSFQEYFAATAIKDWDFFLPHEHQCQPVRDQGKYKPYRIFEPQWKEVILLWLGREDVEKEKKNRFIRAMIEFKDGCTPLFFKFLDRRGFYEYRAYFLAAAGIAEYKDCDSTEQIVEQIIKWSYLDRDIIDEVSSYQFEDWQTREHGARAALKEMKFTEEIKQLLIDQFLKLLESTKDFQLVEGLGEVAIGDSNAIATLEQLLASTEDEETRRYVAYNLGKIDPGNSTTISTFLQMLESARQKFNFQHQWVILNQIGEISSGNPNAIAVLEQTINDKGQELAKIKGVVQELMNRIKDYENQEIKYDYKHEVFKGEPFKSVDDFAKAIDHARSLSPYSLKQKALNALDSLSEIFLWDSRILFGAISSLIKIDPENLTVPQTVVSYLLLFEGFFFESRSLFKHEFKVTTVGNIEKPFIIIEDPFISQEIINLLKNSFIRTTVVVSLEQLLASTEDEDTRLEVVYHLGEIDPGNSTAISNLMQLLESTQSHIQRQALNRLDKIGVGNPNAIAVLQQLLASTDDENMRLDVTDSLGKIDPSNSTAISTLIQLLESTKSKHTHLRIVGYLGEIAISDPNAIAALEKLLSSTEDEDICLEVAYQLGKIDPGNSTSISALVQLLESTEDDFKFEDITERLVEIGGGNLVAIAALEKLLKSPKDLLVRSIKHEYKEANEMFFEDDWIDLERKLSKFLPAEIAELPVQIAAILDADLIKSAKDAYFNMRWQAACALGTIDPGNKIATTVLLSLIKPFIAAREDGVIVEGLTGIGNPTAITFLVELIRSTKNPEILQDAAEGLIDSLSEDWIAATVSALKVPINRFWRFHAGQQVATCYNIIWYCAQALSYPEFYEAWHQHGSNPFNYSPG